MYNGAETAPFLGIGSDLQLKKKSQKLFIYVLIFKYIILILLKKKLISKIQYLKVT